jgi:hypothetical protein
MARIRTIKPEFTQDEDLSALPAETHLLAAGLLCCADDEGYFKANAGLIRSAVFPLRECSVSIHEMLTQLSKVGFIRLGNGQDGKRYGLVVKFKEHQVVNRPTPSKIKRLQIKWDDSCTTHGELTEDSLPEGKGKEVERKGEECAPIPFDCSAIKLEPVNSLPDYMERIRKAWPLPDWKEPLYEQLIFTAIEDETKEHGWPFAEAASYVTERLESIANIVHTRPKPEWQFYTIPSVVREHKYRREDAMWQRPQGSAKQRGLDNAISEAFS